jgi:hypothetical protein
VLCIQNSIEAVITINQILAKLNESPYVGDEQTMGSIDSICNSKKTTWDYYEEGSILASLKNFELGNSLKYKCHFIGNFKVTYVMYGPLVLVKIKFRYSFSIEAGKKIDTTVMSFLGSICNSSLNFKKGYYGVDYFEAEMMREEGLTVVQKNYPDINFSVLPENSSEKLSRNVNFVNDPTNQLTYGFACSIGGGPPDGLTVFAYLFQFKHFDIIKKLLYSPNPVTRLYACDALEHAYKKNLYVLPLIIAERINEIKSEDTEIKCCWGCSFEIIPIKEAVLKAEEDKKYLYHNIYFLKEDDD